MKRINTQRIQNTALLFILIAPFTIAYYASYVFNPSHIGNIWLYFLQIFADIIAILNIGTLWITILLDLVQPEYHKRDLKYNKSWLKETKLKIDVLIPSSTEPISIIRNTVEHAIAMEYPHKTYVLDDGASEETKKMAA